MGSRLEEKVQRQLTKSGCCDRKKQVPGSELLVKGPAGWPGTLNSLPLKRLLPIGTRVPASTER